MSQELAKTDSTALTDPSRVGVVEGFDDWSAEDVSIPILNLLQSSSELVKKGMGKLGDFIDPVSGMNLGPKIEVILLRMRNGAIYFDRKKNPKSFVCRSVNQVVSLNGDSCAQCPYDANFNKWHGDEPPKCSACKEFLCVLASSVPDKTPYPIWLSFRKTSFGAGKNLANKSFSLSQRTKLPIYGQVWVISSKEEANAKGDFMNYVIEQGRQLSAEELEVARGFWTAVKDWDIKNSAMAVETVEHAETADGTIVKDV